MIENIPYCRRHTEVIQQFSRGVPENWDHPAVNIQENTYDVEEIIHIHIHTHRILSFKRPGRLYFF